MPTTKKSSKPRAAKAPQDRRREHLTSCAIDWLDGPCEDMVGAGADAVDAADAAIEATLAALGREGESEDSFDREKVIAAAQGIIDVMDEG